MNEKQKYLIDLLTGIMPNEIILTTQVKGLNLFRIEKTFPRQNDKTAGQSWFFRKTNGGLFDL